jgi:hypothetical protein
MNNLWFTFIGRIGFIFLSLLVLTACDGGGGSSDSSANGVSTGTGGSTARFTIQNNHLITVEDRSITVYSLETPNDPFEIYRINTIGGTLETIFSYQENLLFIGSQEGSIILELSDTGELSEIASVVHTLSCDPVVANQTQMFITIRSGRDCWGSTISNRLMVYDITELSNPVQTANITIDQPFGLALQDTTLFVCYADGLKEYDVTDSTPILLNDYQDISCNDLIDNGESLVLTGDDSISQVVANAGIVTVLSELVVGD